MTRYFLHGGHVMRPTPENRSFFELLIASVEREKIDILVIPFARDASRWSEKFEEFEKRIGELDTKKGIKCILASDDISDLLEQIEKADILFLWGGETEKLQNIVERVPDFSKIIQEKIVAGSSAGALVFSKFYYENDNNRYRKGLGILNIGMICHWKDQREELEYIKKYGGVEEVLCIKEGEYQIREN